MSSVLSNLGFHLHNSIMCTHYCCAGLSPSFLLKIKTNHKQPQCFYGFLQLCPTFTPSSNIQSALASFTFPHLVMGLGIISDLRQSTHLQMAKLFHTAQWSLADTQTHLLSQDDEPRNKAPDIPRQGHVQPYTAEASLHVPLKKFAVEITSDGVIDEPFWSLGLSTCLVLEYHIIIPPSNHTCQRKIRLTRSRLWIFIT